MDSNSSHVIHIDPKMEKLPDLGVCTPVSNKPTCPIISWGYSAELKSPKENAGKPYVWWYKLQDI